MKTAAFLPWALSIATPMLAAEPALELRAVIAAGKTTQVLVVDKNAATKQWLDIGQTLAGFTLESYDAARETALFIKGADKLTLRLVASRTGDVSPPTPEALAAIQNNMRQLQAATKKYFAATGKEFVTAAELVGPDKLVKELKSIAGENYAGLRFSSEVIESPEQFVVTASGERVPLPAEESFVQKPWVEPNEHLVQPGDTGMKIAQAHHLTVKQLMAANPDVNFAQLRPGQKLKLK